MKTLIKIAGIIIVIIGITACPVPEEPCDPVHDTIYVVDTLPVYDTIYITQYIHDTIYVPEIVTFHDTVYDCDTITDEIKPYGQDASLYGDLTFQDEFEGDELDESKWDHHLESGWITNPYKNWHFENGSIHIWPRYDEGKFWDRNFETIDQFRQLYGYFEIECKLPYGAGVRPAFWLYNNDDVNGRWRPEIDILEAYGYIESTMWVDDDLHLVTCDMTVWLSDETGNHRQGNRKTHSYFGKINLSADYHVYACRWDSEGVTFYFDGQQVGSKIETDLINLPMFIDFRLRFDDDTQLGSGVLSRDNPYTPTGESNSFSVRYIRVWDLKQ